jgi:hypothetical protein
VELTERAKFAMGLVRRRALDVMAVRLGYAVTVSDRPEFAWRFTDWTQTRHQKAQIAISHLKHLRELRDSNPCAGRGKAALSSGCDQPRQFAAFLHTLR